MDGRRPSSLSSILGLICLAVHTQHPGRILDRVGRSSNRARSCDQTQSLVAQLGRWSQASNREILRYHWSRKISGCLSTNICKNLLPNVTNGPFLGYLRPRLEGQMCFFPFKFHGGSNASYTSFSAGSSKHDLPQIRSNLSGGVQNET